MAVTFFVALPFTQVIVFTTATGVDVGTVLIVGVGLGFAVIWANSTRISGLEKVSPETLKRLLYGISS